MRILRIDRVCIASMDNTFFPAVVYYWRMVLIFCFPLMVPPRSLNDPSLLVFLLTFLVRYVFNLHILAPFERRIDGRWSPLTTHCTESKTFNRRWKINSLRSFITFIIDRKLYWDKARVFLYDSLDLILPFLSSSAAFLHDTFPWLTWANSYKSSFRAIALTMSSEVKDRDFKRKFNDKKKYYNPKRLEPTSWSREYLASWSRAISTKNECLMEC